MDLKWWKAYRVGVGGGAFQGSHVLLLLKARANREYSSQQPFKVHSCLVVKPGFEHRLLGSIVHICNHNDSSPE